MASDSYIIEVIKNCLFQASLIFLLAVGFSFNYRSTRVFHVALAVPFIASGYITYFALTIFKFNLPIAYVFGTTTGILVGIFIDRAVYHWLDRRDASSSLRLVASLGIYFVGAGLFALIFGNRIRVIADNELISRNWNGVILTSDDIVYLASAVLVFVSLNIILRRTRLGLRLEAGADNQQLFQALGYRLVTIRLLAVGLGSAVAGWAGALEAARNGIDPYAGLPIVIMGAVACIIGGNSFVTGPLAGAVILGLARTLTTQIFSDRWINLVSYLILLVLVLRDPKGLVGTQVGDDRE